MDVSGKSIKAVKMVVKLTPKSTSEINLSLVRSLRLIHLRTAVSIPIGLIFPELFGKGYGGVGWSLGLVP